MARLMWRNDSGRVEKIKEEARTKGAVISRKKTLSLSLLEIEIF